MIKVVGHTDDPAEYNRQVRERKGGCTSNFACVCGAILYDSPCLCIMAGTCPECGYDNNPYSKVIAADVKVAKPGEHKYNSLDEDWLVKAMVRADKEIGKWPEWKRNMPLMPQAQSDVGREPIVHDSQDIS